MHLSRRSSYDFESRLDRAFKQRIYLMNAEHIEVDNTFDYLVMGASGKPYHVGMGENSNIFCSCPDHTSNHKLCKHLLFLLIRVLRLSKDVVYKSYFLKNGFLCTPKTIEKCLEFATSKQCKNLIGLIEEYDYDGYVTQREIEEDDDCPICFETLYATKATKETVIYCKSTCGKSVHRTCFMKWANHKSSTCVYCKADWVW